MSHSFTKIWIHAIWATKDRSPLLDLKTEKKVYEFMQHQFLELGCEIKAINGMPDHVHCLFLLNPQKSVSEVMKQIKGSTSHFINDQNLIFEKFSWQTGYAAYSVSESVLDKVFQYIQNQKDHHQIKTFAEEYKAFLKLYGLQNPNP